MDTQEKIEELKIYLKEKRLDQKALSEMFKTSQPTISAMINGKKPFGKKVASLWESELGIRSAWLLTGDGNMLKNGIEKEPEPTKNPAQLELDFSIIAASNSKIADACHKAAIAAEESAKTARILADKHGEALDRLTESLARIEKKIDDREGALSESGNVLRTGRE